MQFPPHAHPVITCRQAKEFESSVLADEMSEWGAMKRAGQAVAQLIVQDYQELRMMPEHLRVLALVGKGNNAGDALIACGQLLADYPRAQVELIFTHSTDELSPLAARALQQLEGRIKMRLISVESRVAEVTQILAELGQEKGFHLCIDGLLGMSYVPPLRAPMLALIEAVNAYEAIDLRASIDLPSGLGDDAEEGALCVRADFSYATGIAKKPLFASIANSGRVRYIDLGFFNKPLVEKLETKEAILTDAVLAPIRRLRPAAVDKRVFGHLFIVGGSAYMPGALLMAVQAAVRSGVGLVTAFAPASVTATLAAQVPEAMWIPWPESKNGTLSPRAMSLLLDRVDKATSVLVGPGMGKDRATEMVTQEIVKYVKLPVLLDADALRVPVMQEVQKRREHYGRVVVTPHMGEYMRIAKYSEPNYQTDALVNFSKTYRAITVLKGANTRICNGESVIYNTQGSPVLSRGGSGDLLAGLIGGMMAQKNDCVEEAVARGVLLHGLAAQRLARVKGQVAVNTTQVLNYLSEVLRT